MSPGELIVVAQRFRHGGSEAIRDRRGRRIRSRERTLRLTRIAAGLERLASCRLDPGQVDDEYVNAVIAEVHSLEYLDFLRRGDAFQARDEVFDPRFAAPGVEPDTPLVTGILGLAREGARTAVRAARCLLRGERFSYALCRPPGHHAGASWMGGYCYLNNAVCAVRELANGGLSRVSVIDFDFHFGNGTAALLRADPETTYGSVHGATENHFPYMPTAEENERQTFEPFTSAPTVAQFLAALERLIDKALGFGAAAFVVSVGYDIVAGDPHGSWDLPPAVLEPTGRLLRAAGVPLCCVQEGGYAIEGLAECAYRFGRGITGAVR